MARRVDLKDQTPLIIDESKLVNGKCAVCRCGLSGAWPMCDGTHKATIGEEPGKLYHYDRDLPQGSIRRHELGDLEMPGHKQPESKERLDRHEGAGAHRGRRPEAGVKAESTRGNEAGVEGNEGAPVGGDAQDELVTGKPGAAKVTEGALATGGAEGILPKNESGRGGEAA